VLALGALAVGIGATPGNLLGAVAAGAMFDRAGSCAPVMWGCLALSTVTTLLSARLIGAHGPSY
jgi:hypothetical protein